MINLEASLVELKSRRALLEIQQLGLRRRVGEIDREQARAEEARRRGESDATAVQELRERRLETVAELERLESQICELDDRIGGGTGGIHHLEMASLQASGEIDRMRTHIQDTLRSLAEPLEILEQLFERQRSLTGRIREATGRDNSYQAYIDTALLRSTDYDDQLQYVVEQLKNARVVS